jgi:hypothetical protein
MSHNPFFIIRNLKKMFEWLKRFFSRKSKVKSQSIESQPN